VSNYSRTKQDTLISTFSATCKADERIPFTGRASIVDDSVVVSASNDDLKFTIAKAKLATSPGAVSDPNGAVSISYNGMFYQGYVAWSGSYSSPTYSLRGVITDVQSGSTVGDVILGLFKDREGHYQVDNLVISQNAIDLLTQQGKPPRGDYWSTLPPCVTAGPFAPNGLRTLQQLNSGIGATLLQQ